MTDTANSFLDSLAARGIALLVALAIGAFMVLTWGDDFQALLAQEQDPFETIMAPVGGTPAAEATPELDACLTQRVGDVDRMKSEGIINDAQYEAFRQRATSLCHAQHGTN